MTLIPPDLQCLGGRERLGSRGAAGRDDDVAVRVDGGREPGWDHRRRVVLVHDRGAFEAIARLERRAVVIASLQLAQLA
jgi:hypothetical protein